MSEEHTMKQIYTINAGIIATIGVPIVCLIRDVTIKIKTNSSQAAGATGERTKDSPLADENRPENSTANQSAQV